LKATNLRKVSLSGWWYYTATTRENQPGRLSFQLAHRS